jgi:hypothetical protein
VAGIIFLLADVAPAGGDMDIYPENAAAALKILCCAQDGIKASLGIIYKPAPFSYPNGACAGGGWTSD